MQDTLGRIASALSAPGSVPKVDPIALPAPVWLLKGLHDLTLALHFVALHLLLGGLVLALVWNLVGHLRKNALSQSASEIVAAKLPIVTTYVINLGVPPLLFAQVLYGQALYTSSILMAAWWLSAVFLIMGAYAVLYRMSHLASVGKAFWPWALVAVPVLALVGRLFSGNMTLMLRPEAWAGIYAADPHGTSLPADPTTWARFALVMLSSVAFGGLGTALWSFSARDASVARHMRRQAALVALVTLPAVLFAGLRAMGSQPLAVQAAVLGSDLGRNLSLAWVAAVALGFFLAALLAWKPSGLAGLLASLPGLVAIGTFTVVRDLVRDATLAPKGLDVWTSAVHSNWTIVGIFLASLVVGIAMIVWIAMVVARAKPSTATLGSTAAVEGSHV